MSKRFEYLRIRFWRNTDKSPVGDVVAWVYPPSGDVQEIDKVESRNEILNQHGREGWEMVGSPVREYSTRLSMVDGGGQYQYSMWNSAEYTFKRELP